MNKNSIKRNKPAKGDSAKKAPIQKGNPAVPELEVSDVMSKWRVITYASVIFLPPYGLYRIWSPESTFRRAEKWVWTMIVIMYLFNLVKLIVA